ncbi:MAG TPA: hypothetical protein VFW59_04010 [Gallionella sp.]|nr:hypothetical protein [Gallionella sp.]
MVISRDLGRKDGTDGSGGEERRVSPHLRVAFETACKVTAPFFDPKQEWGGMSLTMYARQALREAYPELTQQDLALLFAAVQRFHRGALKK